MLANLNHRLEDLVMSMLSKEPDGRPMSAVTVRENLGWCLDEHRGAPLPSRAREPWSLAARGTVEPRMWLGISIAALIGALGGIVWGILS